MLVTPSQFVSRIAVSTVSEETGSLPALSRSIASALAAAPLHGGPPILGGALRRQGPQADDRYRCSHSRRVGAALWNRGRAGVEVAVPRQSRQRGPAAAHRRQLSAKASGTL